MILYNKLKSVYNLTFSFEFNMIVRNSMNILSAN